MIAPTPRPGILDISAYVPGESKLPSGMVPVKLSSNETPLGPSPKAIEAYKAAAVDLERYPDGGSTALREAIARQFGLNPANIVCGAGSDELISLLISAYVGPGEEGLYSQHGFLMYKIGILSRGGVPVTAPERDLTTDVDALLAKVTDKTRIVLVANPNNPTGTYLPFDEIRRLRANLRQDIVLVLDAAYCEYVQRNDYEAGVELVATTNNTVMCRTFSKIHGLAALRLGWAYCPAPIADVLNRIRSPFNVNTPAILAGVAAIEDAGFVERAKSHNDRWLPWLSAELTKLGITVTPSVANFVLMHFPDVPGKGAAEADAFLKSRAIILRRVTAYGFPNSLRMTVGTEAENERVVAALTEFLGQRAA